MQYNGTSEDLKNIVCKCGYQIKEDRLLPHQSPGTLQIKTSNGGVIIWYKQTGKLQIQGKENIKQKLKEDLAKNIEETSTTPSPKASSHISTPSSKIFIVHGHDHGSLTKLENALLKLRLEPSALQNTSGNGLPIIETLKKEICKDSIGFSIVLLTPDDIGYARSDGETKAQFRARQNVIFEMGMLTAVLPLERIAILYKEGIELPSDVNGVYYLSFKEDVKETYLKLMKRLKAAGFHIDADAIDAL
ncbi:TIR domain-containing protein [Bartonella sp. MM73XJBT.G]|uniref:TIR domain-containing protein n=1 Tax=Bartonella sp. MM73XJBT.G TaxID=3019097 RepID=UPI00235E8007|nr:TIR domain-containing protein [Bartonella sp. MM73XJBT.G]